jgi:hypothetical protein
MTESKGSHQDRLRYIQVVKEGVQSVPQRVPGYQEALRDALIDILALEGQHVHRRLNISQQITAQIDALGSVLHAAGWDPDAEEQT